VGHHTRPHRLIAVALAAGLVAVVLASCGQFAERLTKPTPEEERRLALACAEFEEVLDELEEALDPLSEMREIVASEVLIPSQRLGLIGDPDEEHARLLVVQQRAATAATREDDSHRRAYEALDRSIRAWILISEASTANTPYEELRDDIGQSLSMLYRAAEHHQASCGPPDGVLFAAGEGQ
jgi:hypothetical protein